MGMGDPRYRDLPSESLTLTGCHRSHGAQLHRASRDMATYCTRCSCTTLRIKWAYGRKNLLAGKKKKMKTNITGKWYKLHRAVRASVDTAMPTWGWRAGSRPHGGPPPGEHAVCEFRPLVASSCTWKSSCPVPADDCVSYKHLANKAPCSED